MLQPYIVLRGSAPLGGVPLARNLVSCLALLSVPVTEVNFRAPGGAGGVPAGRGVCAPYPILSLLSELFYFLSAEASSALHSFYA